MPLEDVLDHVGSRAFVLGAVLGQDAGAGEALQNQLIGLVGLVALAVGTAAKAGLAVKKSRLED